MFQVMSNYKVIINLIINYLCVIKINLELVKNNSFLYILYNDGMIE